MYIKENVYQNLEINEKFLVGEKTKGKCELKEEERKKEEHPTDSQISEMI